ncbi:MAG TPA: TonB-dependent receptor [Steroidobacteraceae bacterium]
MAIKSPSIGERAASACKGSPLVAAAVCWALSSSIAAAQEANRTAAATADTSTLETVTVTAQFVTQDLQKTPLSITAVSGDMLEQRGATSLVDVAQTAPNVYLAPQQQGSGKALKAYIRGVGQADFNPAVDPGVGIYIDDVYYSSLTGADFALIDLDRVEILRGPQGTLAGMNSLGGAIKMYTRKPDGMGGYVSGEYGDYNHTGAHASGDFTVVDSKLFARVTAATVHQNGYVQMLDYACVHPNDPDVIAGKIPRNNGSPNCRIGNEGSTDFTSVRLALRWLATDNLEANYTIDATEDNGTVTPTVLLRSTGTVNTAGYSNGVVYDNRFVPYGAYRGDTVVNSPYVTYANFLDPGVTYKAINGAGAPGAANGVWSISPTEHLSSWGTALTLDYKASEALAFKFISSYRHYLSDNNADPDGSPIDVVLDGAYLKHYQFTDELRATGNAFNKFLDYTFGAIYLKDETYYESRVNSPFVPYGTPSQPTFDFIQNDPTRVQSYGLYSHAGLHFTDALTMDLGLRYTKDKKDYTFYRYNIDGITPYLPLSNPANPLNGKVATFDGSHVDYRVGLNYQWTDTLMTYAEFSTGFKGGGVSPRPYFPQQAVGFGPETMDAYEVGLKSQWLDNRVRANISTFYNKYKNYQGAAAAGACVDQSGQLLPAQYQTPCGEYTNVGDADIKGVEGEFQVKPIDRMQIDASVSWLDFNFVKSTSPSVRLGRTAPAGIGYWKWDVGAQYSIPFVAGSTLVPRVDVNATPGSCGDLPCTPFLRNEPYVLTNFRLGIEPGGDLAKWSAAFEMKNLTNRLYYVALFNAGSGFVGGQVGMPRTWMFSLRRDF